MNKHSYTTFSLPQYYSTRYYGKRVAKVDFGSSNYRDIFDLMLHFVYMVERGWEMGQKKAIFEVEL